MGDLPGGERNPTAVLDWPAFVRAFRIALALVLIWLSADCLLRNSDEIFRNSFGSRSLLWRIGQFLSCCGFVMWGLPIVLMLRVRTDPPRGASRAGFVTLVVAACVVSVLMLANYMFESNHFGRGAGSNREGAQLALCCAYGLALPFMFRLTTSLAWIRLVLVGTAALSPCAELVYRLESALGRSVYNQILPKYPIEMLFASLASLTCLLLATATLALLAASRLHKGPVEQWTAALNCPRCGAVCQAGSGASKCTKCDLKFRLEIIEERCTGCGYSLYGLTMDRCPEWGRPRISSGTFGLPTPDAATRAADPHR
jgi:hypothetical protein